MKRKKTKKQRPERNQIFILVGLFILFMFTTYTIWGEDGLMRLWELKDVRNQIAEENKNVLLQNLSQIEEIQKLKESHYVEQVARSELGMIREDEVILVIAEDNNDDS